MHLTLNPASLSLVDDVDFPPGVGITKPLALTLEWTNFVREWEVEMRKSR